LAATVAGWKPALPAIFRAAKDLHLLVFNEILRMLRSAQHDIFPFSAACKNPRKVSAVFYRLSQTADIPGMAQIRAREWGSFEYWTMRIAGYLAGEINPQQALAPRTCYVAVDRNSVVGFVAGHLTRRHGCDAEIEWINVMPERRGAGIASELLRLVAGWFVEQKALRVCVDAEPSNAGARAFYMRHGAETLNEYWLVWNDIRRVLGMPPGFKGRGTAK